jgi:hypothetical protein
MQSMGVLNYYNLDEQEQATLQLGLYPLGFIW